MVRDGRPAGHNLRIAAHQRFRMRAGGEIQIIRIAIQVIEILQQREIQRALDVRIGHALGEVRGQVHGQLLIADRVLQRGFVRGL